MISELITNRNGGTINRRYGFKFTHSFRGFSDNDPLKFHTCSINITFVEKSHSARERGTFFVNNFKTINSR
ncbi:MAG: hypothetical protein Fur0041_13620 [Bacteroidia bacterium]